MPGLCTRSDVTSNFVTVVENLDFFFADVRGITRIFQKEIFCLGVFFVVWARVRNTSALCHSRLPGADAPATAGKMPALRFRVAH